MFTMLSGMENHFFFSKILKVADYLNMAPRPFEGGHYAIPKLYVDNALIIGDTRFCYYACIKGIIWRSNRNVSPNNSQCIIKQRYFGKSLQYETLVNNSMIHDDMYPVRNFRRFAKEQLLEDFIWNSISGEQVSLAGCDLTPTIRLPKTERLKAKPLKNGLG